MRKRERRKLIPLVSYKPPGYQSVCIPLWTVVKLSGIRGRRWAERGGVTTELEQVAAGIEQELHSPRAVKRGPRFLPCDVERQISTRDPYDAAQDAGRGIKATDRGGTGGDGGTGRPPDTCVMKIYRRFAWSRLQLSSANIF